MIAFFAENLPTILAGLVVFPLVAAAAVKGRRMRRAKKLSCRLGCGGCPSAGNCQDE